MPTKRTGVSLNAASTARVGTASCICEPSMTDGMRGNMRMNAAAFASGCVKASIGTPRSMRPLVRASAAHRYVAADASGSMDEVGGGVVGGLDAPCGVVDLL